jgi:hypothetical protein
MRIVNFSFGLIYFFTASLFCFAQEADVEPPFNTLFSETNIYSVSEHVKDMEASRKILIRQDSIMFLPFNYQFLDGKPMVNDRELRSLLRTVPDNTKLLKQEKVFRALALCGGAICLGTVAGHLAYLFHDNLPDRDTMMAAFYFGEVGSLALTFWTAAAANNKIDQAVGRYNLYIMGIPIRY